MGEVRPAQTLRAIMSTTERRGPWVVPRHLRVRATMSSTVLDFRAARLPAGAVELDLRVVMGSVEILVPPGLAVETEGAAIMGTFEHVDRAPAHPDPEAPLLRVRGLVVMGSVVAFPVYVWLLEHSTPAKVSTYAYVNPVVAVFLGWLILGEPLNGRIMLASAIIIGAVAIITIGRTRTPSKA